MTNINQRNRKIKQRFLNNLSNISSYIESQLLHLAGYIVIIERNIGTPVLPEQVIGNQVRILSDPVTVTEERLFDIPLYDSMRRGKEVMILKSGNLLCMARLNFRVKCNNQLRDIRSLEALSA